MKAVLSLADGGPLSRRGTTGRSTVTRAHNTLSPVVTRSWPPPTFARLKLSANCQNDRFGTAASPPILLVKKSSNWALNVLLDSVRSAEVKASPQENTHAPHADMLPSATAFASADVQLGTSNGYSFPFIPLARFVTWGGTVVVTLASPFVSTVPSNMVLVPPSILILTLTGAFVSVISHGCEIIGESMTKRQKAMLAHLKFNLLTGKAQAGRWSLVVQRLSL